MTDTIIIPILEDYIRRVRQNMEVKQINASHRTEQSLRVEKYDGGYRVIIGGKKTAPAETLQQGRPPGSVPYNFQDILMQWMRDKGITPNMRFANALKWKISREGTQRWRVYGRNNNYLNIYTDEGIKTEASLKEKLNAAIVNLMVGRK